MQDSHTRDDSFKVSDIGKYVLNVIQTLEVITTHGYKHGVRVYRGGCIYTLHHMCDVK